MLENKPISKASSKILVSFIMGLLPQIQGGILMIEIVMERDLDITNAIKTVVKSYERGLVSLDEMFKCINDVELSVSNCTNQMKYLNSFVKTIEEEGHFDFDDVKILANELADQLSTDGAYELIVNLKNTFGID
jgi:hypothetical protein